MTSEDKITIEGCMNMYGAHIRLCVKDYVEVHKKQNKLMRLLKTTKVKSRYNRYCQLLKDHDTAEHFLFGGGLEHAINKFSLPLDASYTKRMAIEWAQLGYIPNTYANRCTSEQTRVEDTKEI